MSGSKTSSRAGKSETKHTAELEKRKAELLKANAKRRHTVSVVMFAFGVFITALSFIGDAAAAKPSAWDSVHGFLYGVFGITSFLVGPILIYIAIMISADMTRSTIAKRMVQLILLLLILSAAAQILFVGSVGDPARTDHKLAETLSFAYDKGKALTGGGVSGLVLGAPLLLFGRIGGGIILVLISFVAIMMITDKSLADLFRPVQKIGEHAKEHRERRLEEMQYVRPELERLEEEKRRAREEERERKNALREQQRQLRRTHYDPTEEQRRRSKFESIASVTTGARREVSEAEKREAAENEKKITDPTEKQRKESAEFRRDLNNFLKADLHKERREPPRAFDTSVPEARPPLRLEKPAAAPEASPTAEASPAVLPAPAPEVSPAPPISPATPETGISPISAVSPAADSDGPYDPSFPNADLPEKHLNPVVKHESLICEPAAAAAEASSEAPAETSGEASSETTAEVSPALPEESAEAAAVPEAAAEETGGDADSERMPWDDIPTDAPITDDLSSDDLLPWGEPVEPKITVVEPAPEESVPSDIVEAIQDFTKEQEEKKRLDEQNAKALGESLAGGSNAEPLYALAVNEQYTLPPLDLLNDVVHERSEADINAEIMHNAETLVGTLKDFGVNTTFLEATRGPSVTRYELRPAPGVKISKITGLADDLSLRLATVGVRIEAPIPNKAAVGIEVPNKKVDSVTFREMVSSPEFRETKSKLGAVLGKSIPGDTVISDIAKMPHILIAGTTGSGKSVCVNSIIMSILFRSTPEEVRLLMVDPKAVEFMVYNGIPHLLIPVVTDPKKAAGALAWAVTEMEQRYKLMSENSVRTLQDYNKLSKTRDDIYPLPQIVIFIDELADLMMTCPGEVEDSICRIAQKARAAGMHLVIATQRPSVNVVTGLIKANIPSRIALKVASQVDSRTILDTAGAEKLLGRGDMLYKPVDLEKPLRVQGCWVSDSEIERVVNFIKNSFELDYDESVMEEIEKQAELAAQKASKGSKQADPGDDEGADLNDDKLDEAIEAVIEAGQASTSYLQRRLKLGYGRAARLIDTMEQLGIVGPFEGSKPRPVIMTKQEWYERKMNRQE